MSKIGVYGYAEDFYYGELYAVFLATDVAVGIVQSYVPTWWGKAGKHSEGEYTFRDSIWLITDNEDEIKLIKKLHLLTGDSPLGITADYLSDYEDDYKDEAKEDLKTLREEIKKVKEYEEGL